MKFLKILVANRGEIASRIFRTCKKLKIQTIAIYSEVDEYSPFVNEADEAILIPGNPASRETYLSSEKILSIAKLNGADAIHPGYGFLSENPDFAKKVTDSGINWIGPSPESISSMGDKIEAKKKANSLGIPIIKGYNGENQTYEFLLKEANSIGYPALIKASAGGGGKGMRVVWNEKEFSEALISAKREALQFFANDSVLLEKYIQGPRHIEVQVFGDKHGNAIHLFERDCSLQRRHQKILEESPAPFLDRELKNKMYEDAINLTKSIGYVGAGTVEFVVKNNDYYFLEMNTRLQVEHPVTEMTTGLDLVELQIRIAEGEKLSDLITKEIHQTGHSIETRIYAEDSDTLLPSTGIIKTAIFPEQENIRSEIGIKKGTEISIYYDPMVAKLVAWGTDRKKSLENLKKALDSEIIFGIKTNIEFLQTVIQNSAFETGGIGTDFLEKYFTNINKEEIKKTNAIAFTHLVFSINKKISSTWEENLYQLKINSSALKEETNYSLGEELYSIKLEGKNFRIQNKKDKSIETVKLKIPETIYDNYFEIKIDTSIEIVHYYRYGESAFLHFQGKHFQVKEVPAGSKENKKGSNEYKSIMPGKILEIKVKPGDKIRAGETILILESMKMENSIKAESDGIVSEIFCSIGSLVGEGELLVKMNS